MRVEVAGEHRAPGRRLRPPLDTRSKNHIYRLLIGEKPCRYPWTWNCRDLLGQWWGETGGVGRGVDGADAALCLAQLLPPTTTVAPTTSAARRTSALEQDLEGGAEPINCINLLILG